MFMNFVRTINIIRNIQIYHYLWEWIIRRYNNNAIDYYKNKDEKNYSRIKKNIPLQESLVNLFTHNSEYFKMTFKWYFK